MGDKYKKYQKNEKKRALLALRIIGRRIKEKGYNRKRLIEFCKQVRKYVYNS